MDNKYNLLKFSIEADDIKNTNDLLTIIEYTGEIKITNLIETYEIISNRVKSIRSHLKELSLRGIAYDNIEELKLIDIYSNINTRLIKLIIPK